MFELFASFCMLACLVLLGLFGWEYLREREHKARHDGIVEALLDAALHVEALHQSSLMPTDKVAELLRLLARRRHIHWRVYGSEGHFGKGAEPCGTLD